MNPALPYCYKVISSIEDIARKEGFTHINYGISLDLSGIKIDYWCFKSKDDGVAKFESLRVTESNICGKNEDLIRRIKEIIAHSSVREEESGYELEKEYEALSDF